MFPFRKKTSNFVNECDLFFHTGQTPRLQLSAFPSSPAMAPIWKLKKIFFFSSWLIHCVMNLVCFFFVEVLFDFPLIFCPLARAETWTWRHLVVSPHESVSTHRWFPRTKNTSSTAEMLNNESSPAACFNCSFYYLIVAFRGCVRARVDSSSTALVLLWFILLADEEYFAREGVAWCPSVMAQSLLLFSCAQQYTWRLIKCWVGSESRSYGSRAH